MMVVSNETGKMGVLDLNGNSIIGYKYSGMQFDEYSQRYIVSNDNKYGIITPYFKEGIGETIYKTLMKENYIKEEISELCDEFIYIEMNDLCESLNVGVATSIILYELDK